MDVVNPINVLKLLEVDYRQTLQPDDAPSEGDKLLKEVLKGLTDEKVARTSTPLRAIEEDLQCDLQIDHATFEDFEKSIISLNLLSAPDEAEFDDNVTTEPPSSGTEPSQHELFAPKILDSRAEASQMIDLNYKKRSVTFWRNATSKKRRSLTAVQNRFTRVTGVRQFQDWEKHVEAGGSRMDKLKRLRLETGKQFFLAKKKKHVVKDLHLRRWGLTAYQAVGLEGFKASPDWIGKLKRYYSICDRKITKFVTEKSI
ncbi:hypothetical protein RvY_18228 [Ramazzottius varieornatus]|uniref:HTH CENPB-type domain-containing protein n=1 Tax=Ramazzottius varieornatus TaxID=947166 RepID=A0A1D1W4Z8_RAMVA|nr:hypothetical protein RvY_18228 [Ramazzottius varieornatus]